MCTGRNLRNAGSLQQASRPKRGVATLGKDDVVQDGNAYKVTDLNKPPRDSEVFFAWFRVAARMVVYEHDAGRGSNDGGAEDFARMNDAGIERAPAHQAASLDFMA